MVSNSRRHLPIRMYLVQTLRTRPKSEHSVEAVANYDTGWEEFWMA